MLALAKIFLEFEILSNGQAAHCTPDSLSGKTKLCKAKIQFFA